MTLFARPVKTPNFVRAEVHRNRLGLGAHFQYGKRLIIPDSGPHFCNEEPLRAIKL